MSHEFSIPSDALARMNMLLRSQAQAIEKRQGKSKKHNRMNETSRGKAETERARIDISGVDR